LEEDINLLLVLVSVRETNQRFKLLNTQ